MKTRRLVVPFLALLIAGVDVIETGFLLIVVSLRGERSGE